MRKLLLLLAAVPTLFSVNAAASANSAFEIFSETKLSGEIRPRYESYDIKDNNVSGARAMTVRALLGVQMRLLESKRLSGYMELTSVRNFNFNEYSTVSDGEFDVINDPVYGRVSQGYVDYRDDTRLWRIGRQAVALDNERFVGTEDWRQMPMTVDAVSVTDNSIDKLTLVAAYVSEVYGVENSAETASALLDATYAMGPADLRAYAYLLGSVHDTYGASLSGEGGTTSMRYSYRLEYAMQNDPSLEYRIGGVKADAHYYNLDLGFNLLGWIIGGNYEVLGGNTADSNGSYTTPAFAAPLGSGHGFNGWADQFQVTPGGGLQDTSMRLGYQSKDFGKLLGVYHLFTAENTMLTNAGVKSDDLGSEIDLLYTRQLQGAAGVSFTLKGAYYQKGDIAGYDKDVLNYWLQAAYRF